MISPTNNVKKQNLLKFYLFETCRFRTRTSAVYPCLDPQKRRNRSYQELSTFFGEWLPQLYFMGLGLDMSRKESIKVLNYQDTEIVPDTLNCDTRVCALYTFLGNQSGIKNFVPQLIKFPLR